MTIIAYRDGIMAADSRVSCGGCTYGTYTKIRKRKSDGAVIGIAGNVDVSEGAFEAFLSSTGKTNSRVRQDAEVVSNAFDGEGNEAIIAYPNGESFVVSKKGLVPCEASVPGTQVVGSGWAVAMAALLCGASAETAVEVACMLDTEKCGLPVKALKVGN